MDYFNSFLVIVKSEYQKVIAFLVPSKFEETMQKKTKTQIVFYLINETEVVDCIQSSKCSIQSDNKWLIRIAEGMGIVNDRDQLD